MEAATVHPLTLSTLIQIVMAPSILEGYPHPTHRGRVVCTRHFPRGRFSDIPVLRRTGQDFSSKGTIQFPMPLQHLHPGLPPITRVQAGNSSKQVPATGKQKRECLGHILLGKTRLMTRHKSCPVDSTLTTHAPKTQPAHSPVVITFYQLIPPP